MKVKLQDITENAEQKIEFFTRECYNSLDKITDESYKTFLPNIIKRGHLSALSFSYATFHISEVSRAFLAQMTRHAHLRYLVRSQRYNLEADSNYVTPHVITQKHHHIYHGIMTKIKEIYRSLIDDGIKREDARFVLPNAMHTSMNVTGNFQSWINFLKLRLGKHAQWEIRKIAKEIYKILNQKCPNIFTKELLEHQSKINLDIE